MANLAVIGMHWGDEGKGKVVDLLASRFDVVARFQGGHNAGHSVEVQGRRFAFHIVPSGILHPRVTCVIGNGVVVEPSVLLSEMQALVEQGVAVDGNLLVSDRAHVIAPWHLAYDRAAEEHRALGTTLRGIGPAYAAKAERTGLRMIDLMSEGTLLPRVREEVERANGRLADEVWFEPLDPAKVAADLLSCGARLRPHVRDVGLFLHERMRAGSALLFEGAQATMLDVDHGTYPYVTSSSSSAGGVAAGLGIGPAAVHGVLGVTKAYSTRVGAGPMPTELKNSIGERIRERGREYGVSTGRPRRCGWFDAVAGRYAARVNGLAVAALTLLDVLDEFDEIPIGVAYRAGGEVIRDFPADTARLEQATVEYQVAKGWRRPLGGVRDFDALPEAARDYVRRLEDLLEIRFAIVSVGSGREQTILREELLASWPPRPAP